MRQIHLQLAVLHQLRTLTPTLWRALEKNGLLEQPPHAWSDSELRQAGFQPDQISRVRHELAQTDSRRIEQKLRALNVSLITLADPKYPPLLREIPSPPPWLYIRGNPSVLAHPSLAVVGTRRPTPYGLAVTERLLRPVINAGISLVSGLALGIDGAVHRLAVESRGPTVAVLGTGIDLVYPWEHQALQKQILAGGGAVITEFPLGSPPERYHFPQRNRIISGLAQATLLIEAGERSGALITAKFALDQNREVLTVPGSILSPQSTGVNSWLRLGAKPVLHADDILEIYHLGSKKTAPEPLAPTDHVAARLLELIAAEPVHIDVLTEKSRLETSAVSAGLALLEIDGFIRHLGGMYYCRVTAVSRQPQ